MMITDELRSQIHSLCQTTARCSLQICSLSSREHHQDAWLPRAYQWENSERYPLTVPWESPLDCKEIKPVNPRGNNLDFSLEGLMLKLKPQYFGHLMQRADSWKDPDAGKDWGQEEKGTTEDVMFGWHHRLDGCEFEQALGVGDGQGGLACCDSWGCKESDTTERLNWTELIGVITVNPTEIEVQRG